MDKEYKLLCTCMVAFWLAGTLVSARIAEVQSHFWQGHAILVISVCAGLTITFAIALLLANQPKLARAKCKNDRN